MLDGCVVLCNSLHFLGIPGKVLKDFMFLQNTNEVASVEMLFSRRASGFARYPRHSVSRISCVLRTIFLAPGIVSGNINSLKHSLI